jgi:hypothetical protein
MRACAPAQISAPVIIVEEGLDKVRSESPVLSVGEIDARKQKLNFASIPSRIDEQVANEVGLMLQGLVDSSPPKAPVVMAVLVTRERPSGKAGGPRCWIWSWVKKVQGQSV